MQSTLLHVIGGRLLFYAFSQRTLGVISIFTKSRKSLTTSHQCRKARANTAELPVGFLQLETY